jgi:hypothetical protein
MCVCISVCLLVSQTYAADFVWKQRFRELICARVYVCMYMCMFVGLADVRGRFRLEAKVPRTDVCACLCVHV